MLDEYPEQVEGNVFIPEQGNIERIRSMLVRRRTKVFDNSLKSFAEKVVNRLIDQIHFAMRFEPQNRIFIDYIVDEDAFVEEVFNTRIKDQLRGMRRSLKNEISTRLSLADDPFVVKEENLF